MKTNCIIPEKDNKSAPVRGAFAALRFRPLSIRGPQVQLFQLCLNGFDFPAEVGQAVEGVVVQRLIDFFSESIVDSSYSYFSRYSDKINPSHKYYKII